MRADRLLALLLLLQQPGRATARSLAQRLEVSERTIFRDLEALGAAGVPVYCEPGRNGGVRLLGGYRTDLTGLSSGEAELLPLLGLSDVLTGGGIGPSLRRTETKVLMALPDEQRRRAERSRRRIHLDLSRFWDHSEAAPCLPVVVEAVFAGRRVRVEYRRGGDDTVVRRTLDPYGLVVQGGTWYLVARARSAQPRTYRVSRVLAARMLDETFEAPDDFDLAAFWTSRRQEFRTTREGYRARIRATPGALGSLRDSHVGESMTLGVERDGWTTVDLVFETRWLARERVLALGPAIVVDAPEELRRDVREAAERTAALYRSSSEAAQPRSVGLWW